MKWVSEDADKTYTAIGGLILAVVVVIGLMLLHNADTEKDLLSPEHIMGMIAMPTVILSYAIGVKNGRKSAEKEGKGGETDAEI